MHKKDSSFFKRKGHTIFKGEIKMKFQPLLNKASLGKWNSSSFNWKAAFLFNWRYLPVLNQPACIIKTLIKLVLFLRSAMWPLDLLFIWGQNNCLSNADINAADLFGYKNIEKNYIDNLFIKNKILKISTTAAQFVLLFLSLFHLSLCIRENYTVMCFSQIP